MRKEMEGCRLWLDLSSFFSCFRKQSCIYIDHSKEETVADVQKHVSKAMGLHNQRFCFLHDGWLLLDSESSRVFRDDDIVSVVPFQESISKNGTTSREDDSCVLVKIKKRKQDCEENETNIGSPEKVSNIKKCKVQKKNPEINERISLPSCPSNEKECVESSSSESEDGGTKITGSECSSDQTRSFTESLAVVSAGVKDNLDMKNQGPLKKQKRRRVRKRKKTQVCPQPENVVKESPYLLHKKLQGVSHLLNSFSTEKKQHVFFTDDTVETTPLPEITSRIQTNSEVVCNTFPAITSYNGKCTASAESPAGELTKLMSLVDGQCTPVFERKKISTPSNVQDSNGKISEQPNQQPVIIKEMPVKDSIIKFKVLKMINYCPEVSREITAKVVSSDFSTSQLCLLVIDGLQELQAEKGKFSLDDQNDDETETAHNDPHVSLNWNEILDPQKLNI